MNQNGITIAMLQEAQLQETIENQFEIKVFSRDYSIEIAK